MKLGKYSYPILIAVIVLALASCSKTTSQIQRDDEKILLSKYIQKYHTGISPSTSGIYYIETKRGTGDSIVSGNYVKMFYRGYLIENSDTAGIRDGYEFDTSGNYEPFGFTVGTGSVIAGWDEEILRMRSGGEAKWIIPSQSAYAAAVQGSIPAYSTLVFYVRVYKVYRSSDTLKTIQKVPRVILQ
ncbi:MAG: FKBP-type peptidyl-prolyl cis-trans isomerase [Prolixibacteraceae bacterium]